MVPPQYSKCIWAETMLTVVKFCKDWAVCSRSPGPFQSLQLSSLSFMAFWFWMAPFITALPNNTQWEIFQKESCLWDPGLPLNLSRQLWRNWHMKRRDEEWVSYSAAFGWCQRLQKEVRGTGWMQPGWGEAGALETDWSLLKQNAACRRGKCEAQHDVAKLERFHYN